jgi:hypothetical protein
MSNEHSRAQVEYLRAQASLSLMIAEQTTDATLAAKLRAEAARYQAVAAELEGQAASESADGEQQQTAEK